MFGVFETKQVLQNSLPSNTTPVHRSGKPVTLNMSTFSAASHQTPYPQVTKSTGSAYMPFILKEKLKFSLQRRDEPTKTPGYPVN